ncbi:hypothetical protein [Ideonella margarita]|uniref:Protein ImuA n=1 Tax=Ideonella margarita TaxID=2984191 RepID=A0ABU9CCM4_9BURK
MMTPSTSPPLPRAALLAQPQALHPALWRAQGRSITATAEVIASGFPLLDAELPDAGWPTRALIELLPVRPGLGEIRLLAPALVQALGTWRSLMLFNPPAEVCADGLHQLGVPVARCLVVRGREGARDVVHHVGRDVGRGVPHPGGRSQSGRRSPGALDVCWALEQALRSGHVGAVLAWPGASVRPDALRRLQLAAHHHGGLAVVFREPEAQQRPSPATLRMALTSDGPDALSVHILKRRGPVLLRPLRLALPPVLSERGTSRAQAQLLSPGVAAIPSAAPAAVPLSGKSTAEWLREIGALGQRSLSGLS